MNTDKTVNENAKDDWMKIVKKHRKRQKGLPALSRLNTNAGNVEHNINMFNSMQPEGHPSVDASNGNVSSAGMGESLITESPSKIETVELYYPELFVQDVPTTYVPGSYWEEGYYNTEDMYLKWTYNIDKIYLIEYLQEEDDILEYLGLSDEDDSDVIWNTIESNLETIVDVFNKKILDRFEDDAVEDARENYEYVPYEPEYEPYDEQLDTKSNYKNLDDKFDMSMRTLL